MTKPRLYVFASLVALAAGCRQGPAPRATDRSTEPRPPALDRPSPPSPAPAPGPGPSEVLGPPPAELAGLRLAVVASGFERPVAVVPVPGDARRRLAVVEQVGRIRLLEGGRNAPGALLELRGQVSRANEQGLLGLAFHPRFEDNRKLYVHYTDRTGATRVVEYRLGADDAVEPASARDLLTVKQPYSNHNGGHLVFGPDGRLWIGRGDGGAAGDPLDAGQDDDTLLGKMLRLDVDAPAARPEIVAKGLRNPWRYSFDTTGDLYIADVGQDQWESVFVVGADHLTGHNFGWSVAEGRHCFDAEGCDRSTFTAPVANYDHRTGCSITGGVVYRGKAIPALTGVYFYADFCTAIVRSFRWSKSGIRDHWEWKPVLDPEGTLAQISSFGVDHDGELYVVSLGGDLLRFALATPGR